MKLPLCDHSDKYITFRCGMKKSGWTPYKAYVRRSPHDTPSLPHTSAATLLARLPRGLTEMLRSTFSLAVTLHYHFILLSLLWTNPSYYFPSDLLEATERSRDYSVSQGGAITYCIQWCFSCRAFKLQKVWNLNGDYFSGDEVAFFISKLLFCDWFTRDGFGFLALKDVA